MSAGPSVALEVSCSNDEETVEALRQVCGPADPAIAKALQTESLRAVFGDSKALNGVHCTDLAEDASRELRIAFGQD